MTLADFTVTRTSNETPGPGSYEADPIRSFGGRYSTKRSILEKRPDRPAITQNVDYPPVTSSLSTRGSSFGKPGARRAAPETGPGPNYAPNPNEFFTRGSKIKGRYKDPDTSIYPGPGQYTPVELSKTRVPPQGNRASIKLSEQSYSPGPAAYTIPEEFGREANHFTIRPRTSNPDDSEDNPGFAYNNPSKFGSNSSRYSFPKAPPSTEYFNENPGPGAYDPTEPHDRRIFTKIHQRIEEPRPLTADVEFTNTRQFPSIRTKTIGSRCRSRGFWDVENTNPGPSYLPDTSLNLRPITIGKKLSTKSGNDTPGPSDYMPRNPAYDHEPSFSVKGPSSRDDWLPTNQDVPGPGLYSISRENTLPRWSIGEKSFAKEKERARTRAAALRSSLPLNSSMKKAQTSLH